jgi:hypothetical protein
MLPCSNYCIFGDMHLLWGNEEIILLIGGELEWDWFPWPSADFMLDLTLLLVNKIYIAHYTHSSKNTSYTILRISNSTGKCSIARKIRFSQFVIRLGLGQCLVRGLWCCHCLVGHVAIFLGFFWSLDCWRLTQVSSMLWCWSLFLNHFY